MDPPPNDSLDIPLIVSSLNETFASGRTRNLEFRIQQLKMLYNTIVKNTSQITQALSKDLGKPFFESFACEVSPVTEEILYALRNIHKWTANEAVSVPWIYKMNHPHIRKEPLGTVLIISPWNYPFRLSVLPLIGAIAAGNTVILKPSELAPHTSTVIASLLSSLDSSCYRVVTGGVDEATTLLKSKFAKILFTGSESVARIVMAAAAKHLTPLVLELGGKSPAIVTSSADVALAAKRIAWGKSVNAGQTCVAPDYVLVDKVIEQQFISEFCQAAAQFSDTSRIVSDRHFNRLRSLLTASSGKVLYGGDSDQEERRMSLTLVKCSEKDALMDEEIFGPILPLITVGSTKEAISLVNQNKSPLALYVFASDNEAKEVLDGATSGGATVNDVMMHLAVVGLPFGGVGSSGFGSYHGRAGFDAFTHQRTVFVQKGRAVEKLLELRYPPSTETKLLWWRRLMDSTPWFDENGRDNWWVRLCRVCGLIS